MDIFKRADKFEEDYTNFYLTLFKKREIGNYQGYLKNGINEKNLKQILLMAQYDLNNKIIGQLTSYLEKIDKKFIKDENLRCNLIKRHLHVENIPNKFIKKTLRYYKNKICIDKNDILSIYNASLPFNFSVIIFTTECIVLNGLILINKIKECIIPYKEIYDIDFYTDRERGNQKKLVIEIKNKNKFEFVIPYYGFIFIHMVIKNIINALE